ncbi:hypothetical protein ABPG74_021054 [Tetrahymena malaccensis]
MFGKPKITNPKELGPYNLNLIEIIFYLKNCEKNFLNSVIIEQIAKLYKIKIENVKFLSQDFKFNLLIYLIETEKSFKIIQLQPIFEELNQKSVVQKNNSKTRNTNFDQPNYSENKEIKYMISLPSVPQELVQMKKQTQIIDSKKKSTKFDVSEISYNDFCNFAQNYAYKEIVELSRLKYHAEVNQDKGFCPSLSQISYFKLNDLLLDLDKFLLLKTLDITVIKSKNQNCLTYPFKILQYISSQKKILEELILEFVGFKEEIIDKKFCEELAKCSQLNTINIVFSQTDISVDKARLISEAIQRMPNLSKISINLPQRKLNDKDPLVSIVKKDTQNNQLKKLKLGQYSIEKRIDTFNYDLQTLSNAVNLEELEISSQYSENALLLQVIQEELKNFKSLEVLSTKGYFDDGYTYFQFEYNKLGAIQKMKLGFECWENDGTSVISYKKMEQEYMKRQQLLETEIQKSGNDFHLVSLEIKTKNTNFDQRFSGENKEIKYMTSLPSVPQELVQMKKQTQIIDTKKKLTKFDVSEVSYNDFCNFAQNYAYKEIVELRSLVYLWYDKKYYFNYSRYVNNILVQKYRAEVNQDNRNCPSLCQISYFKLNDLLIDLGKFLLLKTLDITIIKSKNQNCLTYPFKILQYISSQKKILEELILEFVGFKEEIIDKKFCEELAKCSELNTIDIIFSQTFLIISIKIQFKFKRQTDISVDKARLISEAIQRMPNLSKISINLPQRKLNDKDPLVSIVKKDTQNNYLKKLKLGQYSIEKRIDTFNYDLQTLSNAVNLEELEISSYQVKFEGEYFKYIIKNTLQQLQRLKKFSFTFKYSENALLLQVIQEELKNFKSLEVLSTKGYFDDRYTYFQFEYNKLGAIQKMILGFEYWEQNGPSVISYKRTEQENMKRQQLLQNEIKKSGNDYYLASLEMQNLIFEQYFNNFIFKKLLGDF